MALNTRREENAPSAFANHPQEWQKVQNLFAEIIGANIRMINGDGHFVSSPSIFTPDCRQLTSEKEHESECWIRAIQVGDGQMRFCYECPHGLCYYSLKVKAGKEKYGIAIGPVIIEKRAIDQKLQELCAENGWNFEDFKDRYREVNVFSNLKINTVLELFKETAQYFIKKSVHERELEELMPGFADKAKTGRLFSTIYNTEIAETLLDIALQIVEEDAGSVLFFDKKSKSFYIRSARGIAEEYLGNRISFTDSVAGWVAERGKPMLLECDTNDAALAPQLKRPDIKASFVIPIQVDSELIGVFCVNTKRSNKKFNRENLFLLSQLSRLAGISFARSGNA